MGVKQIQMFHVTHAQCQYEVPKWLGSDLHICINTFFFGVLSWKIEATAECVQPTRARMSEVGVCVPVWLCFQLHLMIRLKIQVIENAN